MTQEYPNTLDEMDCHWALCRLPRPVLKLLVAHPRQLVLAGGYLRAVTASEPVSDIDIFGPSTDYLRACIAAFVAENKKGRLIETDNALTVYGLGLPVQFIHRWTYSRPEDILASFDFSICQVALWYNGQTWESLVGPQFYADLAAKRLRYTRPVRNEDAGGSLLRVLKYYQRGYRIPLDSLGAVVVRLLSGVRPDALQSEWGTPEWQTALEPVLTGLLREVDPLVDPMHRAHLPTSEVAHKAVRGEDAAAEET
jgi:hypothetical protein